MMGALNSVAEVLDGMGKDYIINPSTPIKSDGDVYGIHLTSKGGDEGLELAKKHSPHFAITAYNMPGISGKDLVQKLKELGTKVIVKTSVFTTDDRKELPEIRALGRELCEDVVGADAYVYGGGPNKIPADRPMLRKMIAALINSTKLPHYKDKIKEGQPHSMLYDLIRAIIDMEKGVKSILAGNTDSENEMEALSTRAKNLVEKSTGN